jgi:hypothetical protein
MRGGKYQAIESALGSAVRQIADGVITGQRNHRTAAAGRLPRERGHE